MDSLERRVDRGASRSIASIAPLPLLPATALWVGDASLWSVTLVGLAIPALLWGALAYLGDVHAKRSALIGSLIAVAGIGLLWVLAPAGWSGGPTATVAPALGVYTVGVLWLLVSVLETVLQPRSRDVPGVAVSTSRRSQPRATFGDGGDDDDDLRFLLDEDDDPT